MSLKRFKHVILEWNSSNSSSKARVTSMVY